MAAQFPLTGVGFGAFGEVFPRYLHPGQYARWEQVHNDYLQVLIDGGIVAAGLLVWLIAAYLRPAVRRIRVAGRPSRRRLGLLVGLFALALHGIVDFNHQIPANALLFVVAAAMALPLREPVPPLTTERKRERKRILPLIVILSIVYADRAVEGIVGGVALARGELLIARGSRGKARPLLEIAAIGGNRVEAVRKLAETRVKLWDKHARREEGPLAVDDRPLRRAARGYAACLCLSPASWRPMEGLARVYRRWERIARASGPPPQGTGGMPPPQGLGAAEPGRIAIGFLRLAVDRAPNWYVPQDRLALALWDQGMEEEALATVRLSAASLPLYQRHRYRRQPDLPDSFLEAFAEGAWDAVESIPALSTAPYRVGLGSLELRRGDPERAVQALESALSKRTSLDDRASIAYHLGRAYVELGRHEQAEEQLERAVRHPRFEVPALVLLAQLEQDHGREEEALELLSRARRRAPRSLARVLHYAATARRLGHWPAALEALHWAVLIHPDNARPQAALVETHIEMGDIQAATAALGELESRFGSTSTSRMLAEKIEAARRNR
jgi:tetratricopeptide (TPR) repeat protein